MPDLDAGWPHGSQLPIGQAGEFLVWAPLITQSGGGLHVFLPELDRGLDAVVHRLHDGAYLALQVKTKTSLTGPEAVIAVYEKHLFTPDQLSWPAAEIYLQCCSSSVRMPAALSILSRASLTR